MSKMRVTKRDGSAEPVSFDKVSSRIANLCQDLDNVDPIVVAQKVCAQIYDGVKTSELDELAARISYSLITTHYDYRTLASRIIISNNQKNTSPSFSETVSQLHHAGQVSEQYYRNVMKHKAKLNDVIDYEKDFNFDYFAFKTLERAYLKRVDGKVVERIQDMFMRVAMGIHGDDVRSAIESYELMVDKYFIHATPTNYNCGTDRPQLSSCYLLGTEDSIEGIYKTISDCAKISKWAGGIGVHISNIRSRGSDIRGAKGVCTGIIPMCKVYNETAKYVNQLGKRPGSFAMYLEPWHPDVMEFLDLRKNHGAEDERARELFLAIWVCDLFMERVRDDELWSFFDPKQCPGLPDAFGEKFQKLYEQYESEGLYVKQIPAREVLDKIQDSMIETGTPYIGFKDTVNQCSNQSNLGTIRSSNLCIEINEYSDTEEYAVCNLASIGLPRYVEEDGTFDFEKLAYVVSVVTRNLNKIIDINFYPVPETERSNLRHRPMGIGIQGLADVFAKMRIPFDSEEAIKIDAEIMETIYYSAMKTSCELAKEEGPYETFAGSPLSRGQFQFDMFMERTGKTIELSGRHDFEALRQEVMNHGVRNSLLIALMPTASSSQILGNNECFEPYTSNIYVRRTTAGEFIILNQHLVKDLIDLKLWNRELKNNIIANNGSVQQVEGLPDKFKELYRTAWEIKQKRIMDHAVARQPFVCQSQSLNLFVEEPNGKILTSAMFYAWKNGLKTGSYYIRSRPRKQAQQFTIDPETQEKIACSINNREACEMCSA